MHDRDPQCIRIGVPERIQRLKDELFATSDSTCFRRAEIVTDSYRQTEGQPEVIRRAKAIHAVFERMPVWIRHGEMLLGQRAGRLGARSVYPEYNLDGVSQEDVPASVWDYWTGRTTAATPDGRRSGEPLVDGVGACQGADRHGPAALLRSVAQLDHVNHWSAGNTCNIRLAPELFAAPTGRTRVKALFEAYMRLGGQQLQVNVIDTARLREAQQHPETHADLVVRVAGFSAYFTQLGRATQDEILSRVQHA